MFIFARMDSNREGKAAHKHWGSLIVKPAKVSVTLSDNVDTVQILLVVRNFSDYPSSMVAARGQEMNNYLKCLAKEKNCLCSLRVVLNGPFHAKQRPASPMRTPNQRRSFIHITQASSMRIVNMRY